MKHTDISCSREDRNRLIVENVAMVRYVVGRIAMRIPSHVCREDLESAGIIGLIDAVDKFDPSRGVKLKTYAEIRIRGAVLDELRSRDFVSRSVRDKYKKIKNAYADLEGRLGRSVTDEEVSRYMGIELDELHSLLGEVSAAAVINAEDLCGDLGQKGSVLDLIADDSISDISQMLCDKETMKVLAEAIDSLPEKERLVVALYYYEELTLKEVGAVLGVSESRVCQIHTKAVCRLGNKLKILSQVPQSLEQHSLVK